MNALTIAGSDPSSGAGVQADLLTFSRLGCHGLTAITAITSQNTLEFSGVTPVSARTLTAQLDSVLSDFGISAVKIGMLYNSSIIRAVHKKIGGLGVPIVVDPVLRSTTGGTLLEERAIPDFKKYIVPMAAVMTPNVSELEALSGVKIRAMAEIPAAVRRLQKMGAVNVVVTGIERGKMIHDRVFLDKKQFTIPGMKIPKTSHGGGCAHSAALAASLARGAGMIDSVKLAKEFAYDSIRNSAVHGRGIAIAARNISDGDREELRASIDKFALGNFWKYIPECQTNFVFARKNPESVGDVLGLAGRIVRGNKRALVAGDVVPGGSRHVAAAVLQMNKKFPRIRSAINIRFEEKTIDRMAKKGMRVAEYDRRCEPDSSKGVEGASVSWGMRRALRGAKLPYDAVFHRGDFGKEPMIVVFGRDPGDVLRKLALIA